MSQEKRISDNPMFEALWILSSVKDIIDQGIGIPSTIKMILAEKTKHEDELKKLAKDKKFITYYLPTIKKFAELAIKALTENKKFIPPPLQINAWFRRIPKNNNPHK